MDLEMKTIAIRILALLFMGIIIGCEEDDAHCRVYLVNDGTGQFTAFYMPKNPSGENGEWGPNLLETEKEEYIDDWRVLRFPAGGHYDMRVEYTVGTDPRVLEEIDKICHDRSGREYDLSGGRLFMTGFAFD